MFHVQTRLKLKKWKHSCNVYCLQSLKPPKGVFFVVVEKQPLFVTFTNVAKKIIQTSKSKKSLDPWL